MSAKAPAKRAEELRRQIAHHDRRYYVLDDPEIGDDAYDALLDELRSLEADHPDLRTADSPTQRVGGRPLEKFEQVRHGEPMFSLANARSAEEFRAWETRLHNRLRQLDIEPGELRFVSEPKIDGVAISLTYERGAFGAGRNPRRWCDRRGRHPEPEDDQGDPAADRGRPRAGGGSGRGLPLPVGVRRAQRVSGPRPGSPPSPTRGTQPPAPSASSTLESRRRGRSGSGATAPAPSAGSSCQPTARSSTGCGSAASR